MDTQVAVLAVVLVLVVFVVERSKLETCLGTKLRFDRREADEILRSRQT